MCDQMLKKKVVWGTCDSCDILALVEDLPLHLKTCCPPSKQHWTHGFIYKSILHGWIAETRNQEDSSNKYLHRVYLSAEVLQKCDITIGESVIVTLCNKPCVKRAWVSSDKNCNITAISMSKRVLEAVWKSTKGDATVRKLFSNPLPANKITVTLKSENDDIFNQSALSSYLHKFYSEEIIFMGQDLLLPYFGKNLLFLVKDIAEIPPSPGSDVHAREPLTPSEQFYRVVTNTQWVISRPESLSRTQRLRNIGGLSDIVQKLQKMITKTLFRKTKRSPVLRGILLYGSPGSGKTLLARALAHEADADYYEIEYNQLYSKVLGETEARLQSFFTRVKSSCRSVVLLDRIHSVCPKRSSTTEATDLERRVLSLFNAFFDDLSHCDGNVMVLATTYDPDGVAPSLRRIGRLELEIEIGVPDPGARLDILSKLLGGVPHELSNDDIWSVAQTAHGFVGADLASLVSVAHASMLETDQPVVTMRHLISAQKYVHPSAMKEVLVNVPNVRWSDIGGQDDLKLKLQQIVEWPITHPESFAKLGIRQPRGVLMFGPPGCSKTMIAKALASESKLNFLSIKGPELFNKWLGESERAVRTVFRRARQVAPAIVFFDEIDALGGERTSDSGSNSNVEDRVLSQLLVEMNGIELLENVFVVAATNRPDLIDKALLRPGRLDHKVYVPLPDEETRRKILCIQMGKMPVETSVNLDDLVQATDGYSGAEVVAVCQEAALIAMSKDMNCVSVGSEHFNLALSVIVPRTSPELLKIFDEFVK